MTAPLSMPLPRGRNAAPREVVWESQRGRLLGAMAAAVGSAGYAEVTVADVIARAGVSRKTFYEHFEKKLECFLAAYDAGVETTLGAIDEAIAAAPGEPLGAIDEAIAAAPDEPLEIARAGTRRYLDVLASNPAFARTFLIEVLAAGPEALARRARVHERFAEQLAAVWRASSPGRPDPPAHVFRACVGAIHELVTDHVLREGAESLPALLDPILEVETALLLRGGGPPA